MLRRVHHIDFVVHDLDRAADRFAKILGRPPEPRESLPDRGVDLVRFAMGDIWIILVQPMRQDSPVTAFLDQHGEGFFHIGYKVDDIEAETKRLKAQGIGLVNDSPRRGVEGWQLVDLEMEETFGVYTQLVEEDGDA